MQSCPRRCLGSINSSVPFFGGSSKIGVPFLFFLGGGGGGSHLRGFYAIWVERGARHVESLWFTIVGMMNSSTAKNHHAIEEQAPGLGFRV